MNALIENHLFFLPFSTGIIFILAGIIMLYFKPKKINYLYGYRTKRSMKNQDTWDFAQRFSTVLMIKLGVLLTLSSVLGVFLNFSETINLLLGFALLFLMLFLLIYATEKELKKRFE